MHLSFSSFITCCALAALATHAQAASPGAAGALTPVVVTATRTAVTVDDALSSVSILTRSDIERLAPQSVLDLLSGLPGVTTTQSGGPGQLGAVYLRGTNVTHTLVLLDGVRIGAVGSGAAALEQIPVEQIDRIEIVRGPRSSLYGADAIGGVIQIFTRHGQPDGRTLPSLALSAGSYGHAGGQAGLSGGSAHAWYNLSVGGEYTRGFPACRMGAAEAMAGCFVDDPHDDPYRNWNGAANAGYRWDNGAELAFTWLRSKSNIAFAGSPYSGNASRNGQQVAGARLGFSPLDTWKVTLGAGQSRDSADTSYQGTYFGTWYPRQSTGYFHSRRNQFSWQNDITLTPDQVLTAGVDYQQEEIASSTGYQRTRKADTGAYAQYLATFGQNEVQASMRHDHDQQFGNHDTGAIAWGRAFEHGLRLMTSFGTAFHAPTFNDLYFPPFFGVPSANPNLRPEESRSAELGLTQKLRGWDWALNAYATRIDDLIVLDPARNYVPFNLSRARIRGLEGQLGARLAGWQMAVYLTLQQPENDGGGANGGKLLPRRPERMLRVDLDRQFGAWSVGGTWYAAGKTYDDAANLHRLGGYATLALRAGWQFAPAWRLEAKLVNAFDRDYETVWYYRQPGRSAYLTLRYSPASGNR